MPFFLRKIRKAKWYKHPGVFWLLDDELQADALLDFATEDNSLSIYLIQDDETLKRVVAALACNCQTISNFDYALFKDELVSEIGVGIRNAPGSTSDDEVNSWHRDLFELSASKLYRLVTSIPTKGVIQRIAHKQIYSYVAQNIAWKRIDRARVKLSAETLSRIDSLIRSSDPGIES